MKSILFEIGPVHIYGYGMMIALGIIGCFLIAMHRSKKYGIDPDLMFNAGFIGIIGGFIGSKLTYWLIEYKSVIENPRIMLDIGNGFVVYGGLLFGMLVPWIYVRKMKGETFLDKLDLAVPSVVFAQSIGRIGCLLAGCCWGKEITGHKWYGIVFPKEAIAPSGVELVPTQLISSIGLMIIFFLMLLITRKNRFRGQVTASFMMIYSVCRFFIEFLRDDPRGTIAGLPTSQFLAIIVFTAGLILYFVFRKKALTPLTLGGVPKEEAEEEPEEETDEEPEEESAEDQPEEPAVEEPEESPAEENDVPDLTEETLAEE